MEVGDHLDVRFDPNAKLDAVMKILDEQEMRIVQQPVPPQPVQTRTAVETPRSGCPKAGKENYAAAKCFSMSASIDNNS
jgi:hypothetical protein